MINVTLTLIAIILLIVISWWFLKKAGSKVGRYEQNLIKRCHGDLLLAGRLINFELKKNPNLSREAAARDAIESLSRDNN